MCTVHNLATDEVLIYIEGGSVTRAVCHAWAVENDLIDDFIEAIHYANKEGISEVEYLKSIGFPITTGEISVACGDWAAI